MTVSLHLHKGKGVSDQFDIIF